MIKLTNSLTGELEKFVPIDDNKVRFFVCGPTVYGPVHLGHVKTYIQFDIIARVLRTIYPNMSYIQNITDVDDKIINLAQKSGKTAIEVARYWEEEYKKSMSILGNDQVDAYYRAHDHIDEVISQVNRLLLNEKAYVIDSDGVYLDYSKVKGYNSLVTEETKDNDDYSRITNHNKRNSQDFVIWKFSKPGEPSWSAPFGEGRPGWHIEDTAITEKYYGPHYDIHGGATDLIFPHHEAEIIQMFGISNKNLVNYWIHTGLLTVDGKKMGKSNNNFITLDELLLKWSPRTIRFLFVTSQYSSVIEVSDKTLESSEQAIKRVENFYFHKANDSGDKEVYNNFIHILYEDLNTPEALGYLFKLIREEPGLVSKKSLHEINKVLGFVFDFSENEIPQEVISLAEQRLIARQNKNWGTSDLLRKQINDLGYLIEDNSQGYFLKKIK